MNESRLQNETPEKSQEALARFGERLEGMADELAKPMPKLRDN